MNRKNRDDKKPLTLPRELIRPLTSEQLRSAAGGMSAWCGTKTTNEP